MNTHKFIKGTSKTGFPEETLEIFTDDIEEHKINIVIDYL